MAEKTGGTLLQRFQRVLLEQQLVRPGDHIVLAVSGGADSTALALAFAAIRRKLKLRLTLAHLHHGLRGKEADADADFVRQLGQNLRIPVEIGRAQVRRQRESGQSLEMAAREARYRFLMRVARKVGAQRIATAHTADDQAETILLRLARGTGWQGLGGIPPVSERGGIYIIRPFLNLRREEIVSFLKKRRCLWREDSSNLSSDFLRNRVRHEILPFLETRLNPRIREALCRLAEIARAESDWLENEAAQRMRTLRDPRRPSALKLAEFNDLPIPFQRRIIYRWLLERRVAPESIDFELVERIRSLAAGSRRSARIVCPGGVRAVREADVLFATRERRTTPATFRVKIRVPGWTDVGTEWRLRVSRDRGVDKVKSRSGCEAWIDARRVGRAALWARNWRPGDRIRPYGMAGTKKLQDIFTELRVPRDRRNSVPVLECRGRLVWVPGSRVDAAWAVENQDAPSLHIEAYYRRKKRLPVAP